MKASLKASLVIAIIALAFLIVWSHDRRFADWSWTWTMHKPYRRTSGPIFGPGPTGLVAIGSFYKFGPILIKHSSKLTVLPIPDRNHTWAKPAS